MRLIKQKDSSGCGLACVAMLAGLDYDVVKCVAKAYKLHLNKSEGELYTTSNHLIALADKFGKFSVDSKRRQKITVLENLPPLAILSIPLEKHIWHWVVFQKNKKGHIYLYDSEKYKKYSGFGAINRLNITHYLKVST